MYAALDAAADERAAAHDILRQVTAFFDAFHEKERALIACDTCRCEGCNHIAELKLKAFLRLGEAAFKKIRQFEELAGEDVILIVKRALGRVEQPRFNHLPNEKLNPASLLSYFVGGIGSNILATLQYQRSQKQAKGG